MSSLKITPENNETFIVEKSKEIIVPVGNSRKSQVKEVWLWFFVNVYNLPNYGNDENMSQKNQMWLSVFDIDFRNNHCKSNHF